MRLVTTLNSPLPRNSKRRRPIARAPRYPRKARHARYPAGLAQDGPRRSAGPGLGLADADPDECAHGAPAPTAKARLWPCRSQRGSAAHERGQTGEDQLRLVHQDEPLSRGQRGAAAELLRVAPGARVREAGPQAAEARAGCAGAAHAVPGRPRPGPHGWLAARITEVSPKPRRQELVRSRRAVRGGLAQPVAFRAWPPPHPAPNPERPRGGTTVRFLKRSEVRVR